MRRRTAVVQRFFEGGARLYVAIRVDPAIEIWRSVPENGGNRPKAEVRPNR
jgi:hypothetical protein